MYITWKGCGVCLGVLLLLGVVVVFGWVFYGGFLFGWWFWGFLFGFGFFPGIALLFPAEYIAPSSLFCV